MGLSSSTWYRQPQTYARKKPGPRPRPVPPTIEHTVIAMATRNPWYGYKRIAVMRRRARHRVTNRQSYKVMREHGLLQRRKPRRAELLQASKLFELLPTGPNQLWQMDVTYLYIPGRGWWYAVTLIDYYSRYLLAAQVVESFSAKEVIRVLKEAREEAEAISGPLPQQPHLVTDNGSSFTAHRFKNHVRDAYDHVRIRYRTPTQPGLLERFHRTLKDEEVYWRIYDNPSHAQECIDEFRTRYNFERPHWALIPAEGGDPLTPDEVYTKRRQAQIPRWQGWAREAKRQMEEQLNAS